MSALHATPRRSLLLAALLFSLGICVAACSRATSSTTTTATHGSPAKAVYVTVGNRRVEVPTEIHGQLPSVDPGATQAGQQILITPSGIHPSLLLATQGIRVVWTNLTDQAQRVIFTNAPGASGSIPPGGTFTFATPRSESYTFKTTSGFRGVLNVDPNVPGLP